MTQQNASQSSSTARSMPNEMGLGVTPGQQAAEIVAGLRAKLNMTAEAQALVIAAGGQVVEKNFEPKVLVVASKFVAARGVIFSELIEREVSTKPTGTVVEMAGCWLLSTWHSDGTQTASHSFCRDRFTGRR